LCIKTIIKLHNYPANRPVTAKLRPVTETSRRGGISL